MKKIILSLAAVFAAAISVNAQNVTIPNFDFKACLVADTLLNTNKDGEIQISEANAFTGTLTCNSSFVTDYTGLTSFPNISGINFRTPQTSYLDFRQNPLLETIIAQNGDIDSVNLTGLVHLKELNLRGGNYGTSPGLEKLDLSTNDSLQILLVSTNSLSTLDVSNLALIEQIDISNSKNQNLTSIDLTQNDSIIGLGASNSFISSIDLSNKTKLTDVNFQLSPLNNLNIVGSNNIINLLLNKTLIDSVNTDSLINLRTFSIGGINVSYLDISNNNNLYSLTINNASLDSLDLSNKTLLTYLDVADNNLKHIDLSDSQRIFDLRAANNLLDSIRFIDFSRIAFFYVENNNLTTLDFSKQDKINYMVADSNNLVSVNLKNNQNARMSNYLTFSTLGNPNLSCVQVDDTAFSNSTWTSIDPTTSFSLNCGSTVGINDFNTTTNNLSIYPNPSTGIFNISAIDNVQAIEVYGMNGQRLEEVSIRDNEINLSNHPNGIYFVRVISDEGLITKKLIKN